MGKGLSGGDHRPKPKSSICFPFSFMAKAVGIRVTMNKYLRETIQCSCMPPLNSNLGIGTQVLPRDRGPSVKSLLLSILKLRVLSEGCCGSPTHLKPHWEGRKKRHCVSHREVTILMWTPAELRTGTCQGLGSVPGHRFFGRELINLLL